MEVVPMVLRARLTLHLLFVAVVLGAICLQAQDSLPDSSDSFDVHAVLAYSNDCNDGDCNEACNSCAEDCGVNDCWFCPRWSATADVLFWDRSGPSNGVLVFNTVTPAQNLDAGSFNFGTHASLDFSVSRTLAYDRSLEVRFFSFDGWDSTTSSATTPGALLRFNTLVPTFAISGTSIAGRYGSELHSLELNGRRQYSDSVTLLAGFRYLELDEDLAITLPGAGIPVSYNTLTRNRLCGFQLGADAILLSNGGPFSLNATGKAGIYSNQGGHNATLSTGAVTVATGATSSEAAFVGEVALTGAYQLTEQLTLRGGYRGLWVDEVALAADQIASASFLPPGFGPQTNVNSGGDVSYHGAFTGIEYLW